MIDSEQNRANSDFGIPSSTSAFGRDLVGVEFAAVRPAAANFPHSNDEAIGRETRACQKVGTLEDAAIAQREPMEP